MRSAGRLVLLTVLWMFAWGSFTPASVLSGIAVSIGLLALFPPGQPHDVKIRPLGSLRLAGHVVVQLLASNLVMARQILSRRPALRQGVVTHHLGVPSEEVVTVMTSILALSPGTMTVGASPDSSTIQVHVLTLDDLTSMGRSLARLEDLVVGAVGPGRRSGRGRHSGEAR
ncbi:MAG: Na+/H+ antiporter subunit E [Acidimicrobiales bacterium]|nr:Na+/H+ antiporter subunit E [Acidimicrobiales bacterium]